MSSIKHTPLFIIVSLVCVFAVAGQDTDQKLPPSINTTGEAIISVAPNRAKIDVGVVTQGETSQRAASQNAEKLAATLSRLRTLLGAGADIQTISYSVSPNYRYPQGGGEPTIVGYTATNNVRVTLDDLTKVGSVIDSATQAGANRIQSLQFTLKDEQTVQTEALRDAARRARQKADALASALGVRVVRILAVRESGQVAIPFRDMSYARAETAAATPIEPGTIEVRANVSLTVEIAP